MDASVKEDLSEVTEEMDALYEDVMENGVEMETTEVEDPLPTTEEPNCSFPSSAITTLRRENTKPMTIHVRRPLKGVGVPPIYSARTTWSQIATSRTPASGTAKHFTVIVPRRTTSDKRFQQRQGEYAARRTGNLTQANIGTSSAPIVLNSEGPSRECSGEQPDVTRDEQPASAKEEDAIGTAKACAEARSALHADADPFPAANGSDEASIEVDKGEPTYITPEAPFDAVQASTKESGAEMMPGTSNSDAVVGPTRPLEATSTAGKGLKTPGGRADRRKQELNTTKNGNNVDTDVLDEEQAVILQKKKKRIYTIEEKLRVVEYAMQTSIRAAARDLEYNPNTVKDWCRHADWARRGKRPF